LILNPAVVLCQLLWFRSLDATDRGYAVHFGWVPKSWATMSASRWWRRPLHSRPQPEKAQEHVVPSTPQPSEGIVGRTAKKVWTGLKRIFGFRKGES
jgi:hypothetical protein